MSQRSLGSVEFSDSFSEFDIVPALLKRIKGSPRESLAVVQHRLKRDSVLTQTKRSSRVQEQEFFQDLSDDSDFDSDFGENTQGNDASLTSIRRVRDSEIDFLTLSETHLPADDVNMSPSDYLAYVRTKSGRGASLLVEGEDEHEKVGLIQYNDGCEELRRKQSFHTMKSDTFDEELFKKMKGEISE